MEVKTKRGLNVIEKNIDEQIETNDKGRFHSIDVLTDTISTSLFFKSLAFSKKSPSLPVE